MIFLILLNPLFTITKGAQIMNLDVVFKYNNDVVLNCSQFGQNITFFTIKKNEFILTPVSPDGTKYLFDSGALTIKSPKKIDIESEYFCNNTGGDHIFFNKSVVPHLYYVDSLILTSIEGKSIDLECYLLIGTPNKTLNWTWEFDNVKLEAEGRFSLTGNEQKSSALRISDLKIEDSGFYTCRVSNEYGSHERNITLRVKDQLAPLWPFLGTLGELVILIVIIGCYELTKKKNSNDPESTV
ncbi:basigin-like isoform X1 [Brachionus plicatilis]|uniref:Basigin-like isoform X1 n=1 Tax=Brachionus plicatilis TaxID=10195 RepID=A0A3M7Q7A8_BRAPC|nr:basigin-like isoform X1 [Brachionus plicatilis]